MLTGRRFRVEFTDEQAAFAEQIGAACRAVWNTGLEQRREYRRRGAWMNYRPAGQGTGRGQSASIRGWREVPGHCLQQTLMDLDAACRNAGHVSGYVGARAGGGRRRSGSPRATRWSWSNSTGRHAPGEAAEAGVGEVPADTVACRRGDPLGDRYKRGSALVSCRCWSTTGSRRPAAPCCTGYGGRGGPGCGGGGGHQRRRAARPAIRHRGRAAPRSCGCSASCRAAAGGSANRNKTRAALAEVAGA